MSPPSAQQALLLNLLAIAYLASGLALAVCGATMGFEASSYILGLFVVTAPVARVVTLAFGAALALVGAGLLVRSGLAWTIFVSASWVGLALDLLWLLLGWSHGVSARYGTFAAVDGLLLYFVYSQRARFAA
ncbi:MAG: hypothetical protein HYY25_02550 [Candidatus Wallbacteria bacterium]|nr:hypothetical protein [Candidatus Wallbacteria bacterium]